MGKIDKAWAASEARVDQDQAATTEVEQEQVVLEILPVHQF